MTLFDLLKSSSDHLGMTFSSDTIVFLIYFFVFMGIQVVILMGYIDLRRKHWILSEKVEKLQTEVDRLIRK